MELGLRGRGRLTTGGLTRLAEEKDASLVECLQNTVQAMEEDLAEDILRVIDQQKTAGVVVLSVCTLVSVLRT